MTRRVTVQCPDCGQESVPIDAVVLRWCIDDGAWSYRARCAACTRMFVAATSAARAMQAASAGVEIEAWSHPREIHERPEGPPLSLADVLELRLALIEPDWIDRLQAESPST